MSVPTQAQDLSNLVNGNPVALATLLTLPLITVLSTLATVCGENAIRLAALSVMSSWDIVSGA